MRWPPALDELHALGRRLQPTYSVFKTSTPARAVTKRLSLSLVNRRLHGLRSASACRTLQRAAAWTSSFHAARFDRASDVPSPSRFMTIDAGDHHSESAKIRAATRIHLRLAWCTSRERKHSSPNRGHLPSSVVLHQNLREFRDPKSRDPIHEILSLVPRCVEPLARLALPGPIVIESCSTNPISTADLCNTHDSRAQLPNSPSSTGAAPCGTSLARALGVTPTADRLSRSEEPRVTASPGRFSGPTSVVVVSQLSNGGERHCARQTT